MKRAKTLEFLLRNDFEHFTPDNLHRIAISNLEDGDRSIERWWEKKYRQPLKPFNDHTPEELLIKMYEDYYSTHPEEADRFMSTIVEDEWAGEMPAEHEAKMKRRAPKVDISKYQDSKELTAEEEKKILDNLGMNLPNSKRVTNMGEFEDEFLGGDA